MWDLDHKEGWVWKNWCFCTVVLEKTLQSALDSKEIKPVHPKGNQPWIFIGRTDAKAEATWCEEPTHWKRPWCWERLRAGGESGDSGWDGWILSLSQWPWIWATSVRSWRTEKCLQQCKGLQRVGRNFATEQQQIKNLHNEIDSKLF